MIHRGELTVATRGRATYDVTGEVAAIVARSGARDGLATVFVHHTSASLIVCENADVAVRRDLDAFFARLVPDGDDIFSHVDEGDDDMPAHVKAALLKTSEQVPVVDGELALGTWQGVYVWEHRGGSHRRRLAVHVMGD